MDQGNRTKRPEADAHKYNQLIDRRAKAIKWSRNSLSNKLHSTEHQHAKKKKKNLKQTLQSSQKLTKIVLRPKCKMQAYKSPRR